MKREKLLDQVSALVVENEMLRNRAPLLTSDIKSITWEQIEIYLKKVGFKRRAGPSREEWVRGKDIIEKPLLRIVTKILDVVEKIAIVEDTNAWDIRDRILETEEPGREEHDAVEIFVNGVKQFTPCSLSYEDVVHLSGLQPADHYTVVCIKNNIAQAIFPGETIHVESGMILNVIDKSKAYSYEQLSFLRY